MAWGIRMEGKEVLSEGFRGEREERIEREREREEGGEEREGKYEISWALGLGLVG